MVFQLAQCIGLMISIAVQDPALPDMPLTRADLFPPDVHVVKAHAVTATSFKIDHVYVGPGDLKGKTFFAELSYYNPFQMENHVKVPVAKGEPGIWWIKMEKGELVSTYRVLSARLEKTAKGQIVAVPGQFHEQQFDRMGFVPAWRDGSKDGEMRYVNAVAKAEVFEKIYHADDKSRIKVIDDYVRTRDSIKGAAALMLLLRKNTPIMVSKDESLPLRDRWRVEKHPKIADYVLPFSKDETLPLRVQWEVEQLLVLNKEGWQGSPDEWKMFERWFSGSWKEKDNVPWEASEEKVLVDFFFTRPLSIARRLELAVGGLANTTRSDRFKAELLRVLKMTERAPRQLYAKQELEGFAYLVRVVREDAAPSKRVAAAKLLIVFAPLSAEHRADAERLRADKLDDEVRKEITSALMEK